MLITIPIAQGIGIPHAEKGFFKMMKYLKKNSEIRHTLLIQHIYQKHPYLKEKIILHQGIKCIYLSSLL